MRNFIILAIMLFAFGLNAQKVTKSAAVDYSNRVPATVPAANKSSLWFYTVTSDLYGYDKTTEEWGVFSKKSAYGEMSISNDTSTLSFAGTTPAAIGGLTSNLLNDFTLTNDSMLTYTGAKNGVFKISYTTSFSFGEAGIMAGYVRVGSAILYRTRFRQSVTTATTERVNAAGSAIVQLAPGDVLKLVFAPGSHTGTDVLTVYEANLNVEEIN